MRAQGTPVGWVDKPSTADVNEATAAGFNNPAYDTARKTVGRNACGSAERGGAAANGRSDSVGGTRRNRKRSTLRDVTGAWRVNDA